MNYFKRQKFLSQTINEVKFVNGYFFIILYNIKEWTSFIYLKRSYDTMQTGNKFMNIDEEDPELTYSYDEKEIYDDDVKEAVKNLKISRKLGETAGNYEVTLESIELENYVLKIKNGNLEIKESLSESNGESSLSSVEGTNNPKTFDNIDKYFLVALISLLGFVVITVMKKRGLNAKSK